MVNEDQNIQKRLHLKDLELRSLLEITQAINSNLPEDSLYKIYHFTILSNLNIKKLALYVKDESWECKVHYGTSTNFKKTELPVSITRIAHTGPLPEDVTDEFKHFEVCIPVAHKSNVLAYLLIHQEAGNDTINFLQTFTNIIIVAIENKKLARKELSQQALRRELEIAGQVQSFLFPKKLPNTKELSIKATYFPHDNIGGDYYDYLPISDTEFILCIADVSGKGIPAALLMSNFQACLRTLLRHSQDLKYIVSELNHQVMINTQGERFITFFIANINMATQRITYVNAGHNPPMLWDGTEMYFLDKGSTMLGVFNKLPFLNEQNIDLKKNSLLLAYTDGLTETVNEQEEEFGTEPLEENIRLYPERAVESIHENIFTSVNSFKGKNKFPDDITYLTVAMN
ncbi:MAG: serine/threonine-protein phosphatase [Cytophagaceae bacterium]|jgi:sigma-B regulation protein RsbU (phosphoserine phosphatase)|nr:serine/threonine-protein phosphatase [Cytophagaceae bacterium]